MTREERIIQKIRYWQIILNLTDWVIQYKFVTLADIQRVVKAEAYAYISYRYLVKTAILYLPSDLNIPTIANLPTDDFLIVHELLHLIFYPYQNWFDEMIAFCPKSSHQILSCFFEEENEKIINHLTKILVKLVIWLTLVKEGQDEEEDKGASQEEI